MADDTQSKVAFMNFMTAPTKENKILLDSALEEYRDNWIQDKAFGNAEIPVNVNSLSPQTSYELEKVVEAENICGTPIKLALQERSSAREETPYWTISWRTLYQKGGKNRRFYKTDKYGYWSLPIQTALSLIESLKDQGGLDDAFLDARKLGDYEFVCSDELKPLEKIKKLSEITGDNETWDEKSFFVIISDPNPNWQKILIADANHSLVTFRSLTRDGNYMPKTILRGNSEWWLDNSMLDANVQQFKIFYDHLLKLQEATIEG